MCANKIHKSWLFCFHISLTFNHPQNESKNKQKKKNIKEANIKSLVACFHSVRFALRSVGWTTECEASGRKTHTHFSFRMAFVGADRKITIFQHTHIQCAYIYCWYGHKCISIISSCHDIVCMHTDVVINCECSCGYGCANFIACKCTNKMVPVFVATEKLECSLASIGDFSAPPTDKIVRMVTGLNSMRWILAQSY